MNNLEEAVGGAILVLLLIFGGSYLFNYFINPPPLVEVSGTVKYDDCRQKITLNDNEYKKQNGTFVCNDYKTNSGKSRGGECVKIISDSTDKCQTAYVYEKPAEETCMANSYLTVDDKCTCSPGYVTDGVGACISYNQSCINSFGSNSYAGVKKDANGYITGIYPDTCYCGLGYMWNSDRTSCVAY